MPRLHKPVKPSANKAAAPVREAKTPQETAEKPQRKQKAETGAQ